jgi:hypothetical protein
MTPAERAIRNRYRGSLNTHFMRLYELLNNPPENFELTATEKKFLTMIMRYPLTPLEQGDEE